MDPTRHVTRTSPNVSHVLQGSWRWEASGRPSGTHLGGTREASRRATMRGVRETAGGTFRGGLRGRKNLEFGRTKIKKTEVKRYVGLRCWTPKLAIFIENFDETSSKREFVKNVFFKTPHFYSVRDLARCRIFASRCEKVRYCTILSSFF